MLLLLLVACQYSNIAIMCVMYKQTRNTIIETMKPNAIKNGQEKGYCTLSPRGPLYLQSYVHCKFDARHLHWRLQPFLHPQCARS